MRPARRDGLLPDLPASSRRRGLGYWAIKPDPQEPAQAWCEACDAVLDQDRGWSDRAEALADWKLYCTGCYAEALSRHVRRGWDSGGTPLPE